MPSQVLFCVIFLTTLLMGAVVASLLSLLSHSFQSLLSAFVEIKGWARLRVVLETEGLWQLHVLLIFCLANNVCILILSLQLPCFELLSQNFLGPFNLLFNNFRRKSFSLQLLTQFETFNDDLSSSLMEDDLLVRFSWRSNIGVLANLFGTLLASSSFRNSYLVCHFCWLRLTFDWI